MRAEWLYNRKYYLAGGGIDGVALYEVEEPVGVSLLVGIDAVEIHHLQQRQIVQPGHRQIVDLCARGVAEVFDVEAEFVFLYLVATD